MSDVDGIIGPDYASDFKQGGFVPVAAGKPSEPIALTRGGEAGIGTIQFSANPTDGDTITLNGVSVSFGASGDVAIGAALSDTIDSLVTFLNASANAALSVATYSKVSTHTLKITYDTKTTASADYAIVVSDLTAAPTAHTATVQNGAFEPALSLSGKYTQLKSTRANAAQTATLPDGIEGQEHTIYAHTIASGASYVITPANLAGGTTLTFDAVGEFASLVFLAGEWRVQSISTGVLA
jgi:hypothetical protein